MYNTTQNSHKPHLRHATHPQRIATFAHDAICVLYPFSASLPPPPSRSIRACLTIWALFWSLAYTRLFFFDLLYFSLFELIPLCIMLIMLRGIDFGRAFDQFNRRGPIVDSASETASILPETR